MRRVRAISPGTARFLGFVAAALALVGLLLAVDAGYSHRFNSAPVSGPTLAVVKDLLNTSFNHVTSGFVVACSAALCACYAVCVASARGWVGSARTVVVSSTSKVVSDLLHRVAHAVSPDYRAWIIEQRKLFELSREATSLRRKWSRAHLERVQLQLGMDDHGDFRWGPIVYITNNLAAARAWRRVRAAQRAEQLQRLVRAVKALAGRVFDVMVLSPRRTAKAGAIKVCGFIMASLRSGKALAQLAAYVCVLGPVHTIKTLVRRAANKTVEAYLRAKAVVFLTGTVLYRLGCICAKAILSVIMTVTAASVLRSSYLLLRPLPAYAQIPLMVITALLVLLLLAHYMGVEEVRVLACQIFRAGAAAEEDAAGNDKAAAAGHTAVAPTVDHDASPLEATHFPDDEDLPGGHWAEIKTTGPVELNVLLRDGDGGDAITEFVAGILPAINKFSMGGADEGEKLFRAFILPYSSDDEEEDDDEDDGEVEGVDQQ
jgi:hypothetical protein